MIVSELARDLAHELPWSEKDIQAALTAFGAKGVNLDRTVSMMRSVAEVFPTAEIAVVAAIAVQDGPFWNSDRYGSER